LRSRSRMISAAVGILERDGFRLNRHRALDL
jgi:DNA-binding transcriptional regulator YbjK